MLLNSVLHSSGSFDDPVGTLKAGTVLPQRGADHLSPGRGGGGMTAAHRAAPQRGGHGVSALGRDPGPGAVLTVSDSVLGRRQPVSPPGSASALVPAARSGRALCEPRPLCCRGAGWGGLPASVRPGCQPRGMSRGLMLCSSAASGGRVSRKVSSTGQTRPCLTSGP